jgi:hypothetical protein
VNAPKVLVQPWSPEGVEIDYRVIEGPGGKVVPQSKARREGAQWMPDPFSVQALATELARVQNALETAYHDAMRFTAKVGNAIHLHDIRSYLSSLPSSEAAAPQRPTSTAGEAQRQDPIPGGPQFGETPSDPPATTVRDPFTMGETAAVSGEGSER